MQLKNILTYKTCLYELMIRRTVSDVQYLFWLKKQEKMVDFIVQRGFNKPIPIEVGIGKKGKSQIKSAIRRYKSDYGIIVSNSSERIEKEDNIIKIPVRTFSLM